MFRNRLSVPLLLILWIWLIQPVVAETNCFSLVPGTSSPENYQFAPIAETDLTAEQYSLLENLFDRMDRLWDGSYVETLCRGNRNDPRREQRQYDVTAKTRISIEPAWLLSASMNSDESTRLVKFDLYLNDTELRYIADNPGNRVQVTDLTDSGFSFVRKYVTRSFAGGVVRHEEYTRISFDEERLSISQRHYSNGLLSGSNQWLLH